MTRRNVDDISRILKERLIPKRLVHVALVYRNGQLITCPSANRTTERPNEKSWSSSNWSSNSFGISTLAPIVDLLSTIFFFLFVLLVGKIFSNIIVGQQTLSCRLASVCVWQTLCHQEIILMLLIVSFRPLFEKSLSWLARLGSLF